MKQKRIKTLGDALAEATKRIAGATQHGDAIGIKQNTALAMTEHKEALVTKRDAHAASQAELKAKQAALKSVLATGISFAMVSRDILKPTLGRQYSTAWDVTGFVGSLFVPRNTAKLKVLLERLSAYFTAHIEHQNIEGNITAVRAKALYDQLVLAENTVNSQRTVVRSALEARDEKFKALCQRLTGILRELAQRLDPMDVRYLAFGLNLPGAKAVPAVPTGVIAALVGANTIAVKWNRSVLADHYRIWMKKVGIDSEMAAVTSRAELDALIDNLPSNTVIEIAVSAVNNGGESLKSEVVTITMP